jgi:hypothetical protein
MALRTWGAAGAALLFLAGCKTVPAPPPVEPQLLSVTLTGNRVCGTLTNNFGSFSFTCDPLPIIVASGWLITPAMLPNPRVEPTDLSRQNRAVTIRVRTPSLTGLEVAVRPNSQTRRVLQQVNVDVPDDSLGRISETGGGRIEVLASDDLTTKTWTIGMRVSLCAERVELEIVNTSGRGQRSNPLKVYLFRNPGETICVGGGGGGGGGGLGTTGPVGPGPGPITPVVPPSGCIGGAPQRLVRSCEFVTGQDRSIATFTQTMACSFDDVRREKGFSHAGDRTPTAKERAGARLTEVSDEAACRGR